MRNQKTRRDFLKTGAVLGAAGVTAGFGLGLGRARAAGPIDLCVAQGKDPYRATLAAIKGLGLSAGVIPKGAKVGLLINHAFGNPGTSTDPLVALATARACFELGAGEVRQIKTHPAGYWPENPPPEMAETINRIKPGTGDLTEIRIAGGTNLKTAEVRAGLMESDVLVNVAITKHHQGTGYSGALKNMMGACPHSTCRFFHTGSGSSGWYGDLSHLAACVTDINRVKKPVLCVLDATRFITTNGPFGPGKLKTKNTVLAAFDPVLIDAFGCSYLGLKPSRVEMIVRSGKAGLGNPDPGRARIVEVKV